MRVSPITMNRNSHINFQKKENKNIPAPQSSPLKSAVKAVIVVPFLMPIITTTSCDREYDYEFENEFPCYTDTTARDSVHKEFHSRAINFPVVEDADFEEIEG